MNSLKRISDSELVSDLRSLVKQERELLTKVLHYLKEIEIRQIYLQRGYSSLFAFMTEALGYSEGAAQRRIQAMRLIKEIPEVQSKIETGEISLSVASQMQSFFRKETQKRRTARAIPLKKEEKLKLINNLKGTSSRECEKKLIQINPEVSLPREKTRPLTETKTQIQFTADNSLLQKINRLKSLTSHQNPEGKLDKLFEKAVDLALQKLDPQNRPSRQKHPKKTPAPGEGARPEPLLQGARAPSKPILSKPKTQQPSKETAQKSPPTSPIESKPRSRYIPRVLKDQIWVRDRGQCQYRDPKTQKQCRSNHLLEIDHLFPYSLGGEHSENNLQLKCRAHNQYRAKKTLSF